MTEQDARDVISLAHESFGDLVVARQVTDRYEAHDTGVYLFNLLIQRYIVLWNADDWPPLRDCWLVALDRQPVEQAPVKPITRQNMWSFWH